MRQGTARDNFETRTRLAAQSAEPAELNRIGYWTTIDRQEMDAQFRLGNVGRCRVRRSSIALPNRARISEREHRSSDISATDYLAPG